MCFSVVVIVKPPEKGMRRKISIKNTLESDDMLNIISKIKKYPHLNVYEAYNTYWNDVLHQHEEILVYQHFSVGEIDILTKRFCDVGWFNCVVVCCRDDVFVAVKRKEHK